MTAKGNITNFIAKFKERFPESELSFDESVYKDSHSKMNVNCPIHGIFAMRPYDLLRGNGCPRCSRTYRYDTKEFIRKANRVHNGYFSYDKCVYNGSNNKVIVTCPIHGDFEVKANNHLNGCNCAKCSSEHITHAINKPSRIGTSTKKLSNDDFIKKIIDIHGDKYLLDKVVYKNSRTKVTVTCKNHGDFYITPNHLLDGGGCPSCSNNKKKNKEDIIRDIKNIHGDKYNIDEIVYNGIHKNVTLTCTRCGNIFTNSPMNIIRHKEGCPFCRPKSKMEEEINDILLQKNIDFVREKKFDWLRNKRRLSLDFYLPLYNIAIECQGEQHFNENSFFSKDSNLLENDYIKRKLCDKHGIQIIYYADYKYDFKYDVITDINIIINMLNEKNNIIQ